MAGLQQRWVDGLDGQVAGRRASAKVLHLRICAGLFPGFELKAGRVQRVDGHMAAIEPLFGQGIDHKTSEGIVAHAAQPGHVEPQARQADGDVAVGAGNAFVKLPDLGQVAGLFGDKHRHGFAKREDIDLRHGRSPHGVGQGGPGSRPVVR